MIYAIVTESTTHVVTIRLVQHGATIGTHVYEGYSVERVTRYAQNQGWSVSN